VSSSPTDVSSLVDIMMPQMGVSVVEGTIVAWRVAVGDRVTAEQTVCDISTDKIETEVPAPQAGIVAEILVDVEQTVEVGVVLARMAVGDGDVVAAPAATPAAAPLTAQAATPLTTGHERRYSPVVQRIAAEHGVDLASVTGTGRGGRVRKPDVLALVNRSGSGSGNGDGSDSNGNSAVIDPPMHIESPYRPDPPLPASAATPVTTATGDGLSRMRRQIGAHMKRSLDVAATCTTWAEADLTRVEAERRRVGVTALAYVARATVEALREHPALNAWLDGDTYTRHAEVNLGIAVSLGDDGLIVPVIPRASELSVEGLASRIRELATRARARQHTPDDESGATFTITAPGQFGSIMATPVINQPQVAILDFEAVVKRPVVVTDSDGHDSIGIRSMTILGMSWDHRALDGVLAAQFLGTVRARLENPAS
jgi:pyruvate/2-oxoglutarate dehydrogenase complex dihydrolipoamide acyltransferase (E2) component